MTGDSFADHLPAAFVEDDFAGRFVALLDSIHTSVTDQIDMAADIFDPTTAPPRVVRLIGRWAGIDVPDDFGDDRARHHVCSLIPLVRRRGTRRWLEVLLSSLTGQVVVVEESAHVHVGLRAGDESSPVDSQPGHVRVIVDGDLDHRTATMLADVVHREVPMGVPFTLEIAGVVVTGQPVAEERVEAE